MRTRGGNLSGLLPMPILFDIDPITGMREYFDYDPINDQVRITSEQDVSGFLDRMNAIRNNPEISAKGIKEDWWLYCSIPQVVELELIKRGLSLTNRDQIPEIIKIINTEFPYLKGTDKWHR